MIRNIIFRGNPLFGDKGLVELENDITKIDFNGEEQVRQSIYLNDWLKELQKALNYIKGRGKWSTAGGSFYLSWTIGDEEYGYHLSFSEIGDPIEEILYKVIDTIPEPLLVVNDDKSIIVPDQAEWIDSVTEDDLLEGESMEWPILPKIVGLRGIMDYPLNRTFMPEGRNPVIEDLLGMHPGISDAIRKWMAGGPWGNIMINDKWEIMVEGEAPAFFSFEDMGSGMQYFASVIPSIVKAIELGGTFIDPLPFNCGLHPTVVGALPSFLNALSGALTGTNDIRCQYITSVTEMNAKHLHNGFIDYQNLIYR